MGNRTLAPCTWRQIDGNREIVRMHVRVAAWRVMSEKSRYMQCPQCMNRAIAPKTAPDIAVSSAITVI